jgi:hypothetical protein
MRRIFDLSMAFHAEGGPSVAQSPASSTAAVTQNLARAEAKKKDWINFIFYMLRSFL